MSTIDASQIFEAFEKAPNLNAAIKAFLRHQAESQDAKALRFAKDLRLLTKNGVSERVRKFVTANIETQHGALLAIVSYAHAELVGSIIDEIIHRHSEKFNETYKVDNEKISVINAADFESIARDAVTLIDNRLNERQWRDVALMRIVVQTQLFDSAVLDELTQRGILG